MAKRSGVVGIILPAEWQINVLFGNREFLTVKSPTLPGTIAELVCRLPDKDKQALLDLLHKATQVTLTTQE
jgi:hypothetical protein